MKKILTIVPLQLLATTLFAATNLVSNTAIVTNRVQGIVTYTMSNGVARVQDPSGKLIGTAEERALKVAADGQIDIASAAADAAGTAMEEWREFTATTDVKLVYIDAGFTQDLPALAPNLCGWVAGSFYDREKGEDHYYVWFNREIDYPPSMCARIVSESGTNWLDGAWKDWTVTNWVQNGRVVEWPGAGKYSAEVEYLESHGTELIDTGFLSDNISDMVLTIDYTRKGSGKEEWFGANGNMQLDTSLSVINQRSLISVEHGMNFGPVTKIDGVVVKRNSYHTFVNLPILLFAMGHDDSARLFSVGMLWAADLIINGNTVFSTIPVLDLAGRPAMYDRVSGQMFYNQGTGEFSYGPVTAAPVPCRELVVPRRNANCVLKTGTVITLGGRDGFDADIHKVNIDVGGIPTPTTSAQLPLFYAVTRSGTNTVTRAYTNGFLNVENGFIKEPSNE